MEVEVEEVEVEEDEVEEDEVEEDEVEVEEDEVEEDEVKEDEVKEDEVKEEEEKSKEEKSKVDMHTWFLKAGSRAFSVPHLRRHIAILEKPMGTFALTACLTQGKLNNRYPLTEILPTGRS